MLSNPFTATPLFITLAILVLATIMPESQHRTYDLVLAGLITVATFKVAYRASVVLGTVLMQTAPPRGASGGKQEAFLRAMREVERHPQVLHLPAPHIWQLAPTPSYQTATGGGGSSGGGGGRGGGGKGQGQVEKLVVTMELHVRHDLGDDEVLKLTRWAWEKSASALGGGRLVMGNGEGEGPEVTVGVVRG